MEKKSFIPWGWGRAGFCWWCCCWRTAAENLVQGSIQTWITHRKFSVKLAKLLMVNPYVWAASLSLSAQMIWCLWSAKVGLGEEGTENDWGDSIGGVLQGISDGGPLSVCVTWFSGDASGVWPTFQFEVLTRFLNQDYIRIHSIIYAHLKMGVGARRGSNNAFSRLLVRIEVVHVFSTWHAYFETKPELLLQTNWFLVLPLPVETRQGSESFGKVFRAQTTVAL